MYHNLMCWQADSSVMSRARYLDCCQEAQAIPAVTTAVHRVHTSEGRTSIGGLGLEGGGPSNRGCGRWQGVLGLGDAVVLHAVHQVAGRQEAGEAHAGARAAARVDQLCAEQRSVWLNKRLPRLLIIG